MKKISRRQFLRSSAVSGALGAAAAVCGLPVFAEETALAKEPAVESVEEENCLNLLKKKVNLPEKVDRATLPRVIITTDLEVDDINGILLTLMYSDQYDLAGLVWTAGMYHFNGDGKHTLAEITPNYKCEVGTIGGTVRNAGDLKSFRPAEPHILNRLVDVNYREDYPKLVANNPNYPSPDELLSVVKEGNVEFEGDTRHETEGSNWIKQCILDDDPRLLYITHWGGINTTARALLSIYEEYGQTAQWPSIRDKVVNKVRFLGSGEDNCRADSKIDELFPGLKESEAKSFFYYGQFFSPITASEETRPYYQAEYLKDAFKFNHGRVMGEFHLMGDGQVIYGEPYIYQYGLVTYMDFKELWDAGYSIVEWVKNMPRYEMNRYDWMCCQFTTCFIDIGLRQDVCNSNDHYTAIMFDELAARADWAVKEPSECNHAPIVTAETLDFSAAAGDTVTLKGSAWDPDGDKLNVSWWVPMNACTYKDYTGQVKSSMFGGVEKVESDIPQLTVEGKRFVGKFTVPADAKVGDRFVVNMEVQDVAERPMTRFAQFVVNVVR